MTGNLRIGLVGLQRPKVTNVIRRLYSEPQLLSFDEAPGAEVDCLLIPGSYPSTEMARFAATLLQMPAGDRPPTVYWHFEPLLPQETTRAGEELALRTSATQFALHPPNPLRQAANRMAYRHIATNHLGPYSGAGTTYRMVRFAAGGFHFIKSGTETGWMSRVAVTTIEKQRFLASRGIDALFAPAGLDEDDGRDMDLTRDIDVTFLGHHQRVPSRRRNLKRIESALSARGRSLHVAPLRTLGEARTRLLNRTRLLLHLHHYPWETPLMRWALAAANGAAVISEPLAVPEPLVPGVHYIEAPASELPDVIDELLGQPQRIEQIASACRQLFLEKMTTRRSVEMLLADI